jgi:hypothetical protein
MKPNTDVAPLPPTCNLLRSNTDVTSLLSGTAIKAVVADVTEYVICNHDRTENHGLV